MSELVLFGTKVFFGFFAIMNPITNTSIFLGMVKDYDEKQKKAIAFQSLFVAFIIIAVFCVAGKLLFQMFGITFPAFRIAGGILVFFVGFEMLQGHESKVQTPQHDKKDPHGEAGMGIAISPLAIPILAGPGTIATAMNFVSDGTPTHIVITAAVFAFMCLLTYALFRFGGKLIKFLGENFLKVIGKVMGLILAVIGVEMVILGVKGALKAIS